MSSTRRWILTANAAVLVIWFALAIAVRSNLPHQMVKNLDLSGNVTARTPTSALAWYGLPIIAALVSVMIGATAHAGAKKPSLFNIPDKERFLALPEPERSGVAELLATAVCAFGLFECCFVLALVHWSIYKASTGHSAGVSQNLPIALLVLSPITMFVVGFGLVKLSSHIRGLEQKVAARKAVLRAS